MAKQKKKHKKNSTSSVSTTPAGEVKAQLKRFNLKRALFIAGSTVAAFALYRILIDVKSLRISGIPVIMPIYIGIVTVLLSLVIIFNSGLSSKPITVEMLRLDDSTDDAELQIICDRLNERKKTAKKLMFVLVPFVFTLFFDMMYLFYGHFFEAAISYLAGGN